MSYAWFICPYKRKTGISFGGNPVQYCAMDDFTVQIRADGGNWSETRVNGNVGLVKVRANDSTLNIINGTTGFLRVTNHFVLSDSLSDLSVVQRNAINNRLLAMSYTQAEINAAMGSNLAEWRQHTFLDLLNFVASYRRKIRYDPDLDQIIDDGEIIIPLSVTMVDSKVT